jgi:multisubunit Na+/H+ antiporter MnhB subunit
VSSASAVAAAASLASNGSITPGVAATGAVIASIASVAINLPFVFRAKNRRVSVGLSIAMCVIALLGLIGLPLEATVLASFSEYLPDLMVPGGKVGQ